MDSILLDYWSVHPERDQTWRDEQEKLLDQKEALIKNVIVTLFHQVIQ